MATQASHTDTSVAASQPPLEQEGLDETIPTANSGLQVIRRNGKVTHFDASKISVAVTKAFLAVEGGSAAASSRIHNTVKELTEQVVSALTRRTPEGGTVHIEDIQDQVELCLMRSGEHKAARAYVLYRERQNQKRLEEAAKRAEAEAARAADAWPAAVGELPEHKSGRLGASSSHRQVPSAEGCSAL